MSLLSHEGAENWAEVAVQNHQFQLDDCFKLLQSTPMSIHAHPRAAQQSKTPAQGLTLGLYGYGNQLGITVNTDKHQSLCRYLNQFLRSLAPAGRWTSIHVNKNTPVNPHRDNNNLWGSVNLSISLGPFKGGQLWMEISPAEAASRKDVRWQTLPSGAKVPGVLVNSHNKLVQFCPKLGHGVQPWQGYRISVTAFVARTLEQAPTDVHKSLADLGFPLPSLHKLNLACKAPLTEPQEQDVDTEQSQYSMPGPHALLSTQVAVVVEELPSVSTYLQSRGWRIIHYNHGHVNSAGTARLSHQLKQHEVQALWLDLPVPGRHVKDDKLSSHISQLCIWLRLCEELGTPAVLFGPYGQPWLSPAVKDLCARGTVAKSYHRICAWSYKLDAQQAEPSSTCFVAAAAARALPGHACKCSVRQSQHRLDWATAKMPHQRRLRAQLHAAVAAHVAEQWAEVQLPPVSDRAHPTHRQLPTLVWSVDFPLPEFPVILRTFLPNVPVQRMTRRELHHLVQPQSQVTPQTCPCRRKRLLQRVGRI